MNATTHSAVILTLAIASYYNSPASTPPLPPGGNTTLDISKGKSADTRGSRGHNDQTDPPIPPGSNSVGKGNAIQKWNLGVNVNASSYASGGQWASDNGVAGIYIHVVRVKQNIAWECDNGGEQANCSTPVGWSWFEFQEVRFADYKNSNGTPLKKPSEQITLAEIANGEDHTYNFSEIMRGTKDAYQPSAIGMGCWKLWMSESYFVLPGHPNYEKIVSRLDALDEVGNGRSFVDPSRPAGEDPSKPASEDNPRNVKVKDKIRGKIVGWDGAGVIDGDGDGVDDLIANAPASQGIDSESLDELINSPKDANGVHVDPGDQLGHLPGVANPPGQPGLRVPAIAEWIFVQWDFCGGSKLPTPISGVGQESLCDLLEGDVPPNTPTLAANCLPELDKDWIYRCELQ